MSENISSPQPLRPAKGRSTGRRVLTWLLIGVSFIAWIGAAGATIERARASYDARTVSRVGVAVSLGHGRVLNMNCTGPRSAAAGTIVLEAGLGESSVSWSDVQSRLSADRRVCSYDRAGYGWSPVATGSKDAITQGRELYSLLHAAGERGPYTLAAHSLGAFVVRAFASAHVDEVHALILVDPTSENDVIDAGEPVLPLLATRLEAILSRVGLTRIGVEQRVRDEAGATPPQAVTARASFLYRAQAIETSIDELAASVSSAKEMLQLPLRADLPVKILLSDENFEKRANVMSALTKRTSIEHLNGGHYLQYEHLARVTDAIALSASD
ncbi:alpha/beta fold hydrolase [Plantibacter sp. Mn2098]|uniref:alpha/beta hydrolase n=1 Tax=Plantibacter sp. Mn2098 TaxID=3395266 RepID=UPI003BEB1B77